MLCSCGCGIEAKSGNKYLYGHNLRGGVDHWDGGRPRDKMWFWDRVNISDEVDGCWEWSGRLTTAGYGFVRVVVGRNKRKQIFSHRVSYEMVYGPIEPQSLFVLHKCDNRKCVRPDHLFLGTQLDNVRDAISKNRMPWQKQD